MPRIWLAALIGIAVLSVPAPMSLAQRDSHLLITEVYYDTPGEDSREEWFELTNLGQAVLALADFKVGDEESPGGAEGMVRFPADAVIQPGETIVVAQTSSGFQALFGAPPDFELQDDNPGVPDMAPYAAWAAGDVALNNDGDELLLLGSSDYIVDAVSYGQSDAYMQPSVPDVARGQSIARVPAHCDSDRAGDWRVQPTPTPGAIDLEAICQTSATPATEAQLLPIGAIQGPQAVSPLLNEPVTFEGIVTGLLEDRNTRGAIFYTLFVQDIPGREDGDPRTSDAIAVFHGPRRPNFVPGDRVRVSGQVTEFYGLTELDDNGLHIELLSAGNPLPPAATLQPPLDDELAYFEALEAMRVSLPAVVVVGPTFSGCGFAVVPGTEPWRFVRRRLSDEADTIVPVLHVSDVACGAFPQVKVGDVVQGLTGPLVYHFDQFKIVQQLASELVVLPAAKPQLEVAPMLNVGEISVATFNLHDLFDASRDSGREGEPQPSPEAVRLKETKLVQTISTVLDCPTLLAVQEVENLALLESLAHALEAPCQFRYGLAHRESADMRGIDLGLMADPQRAQILSVATEQVCSPVTTALPELNINCPPGQDPLFSRPPLQVTLLADGEPYSLIVVHLKSKREGEAETAARRMAQAEMVAQKVESLMRADPAANVIVLGDFNDYELSAPMALLTGERTQLSNAAAAIPLQLRYTYNFGGVSQLLDGILLSPALASRLVSSQIFHLNADFPFAWSADGESSFRSSDHDIPLVVLRTATEPVEDGERAEEPDTVPAPSPPASTATQPATETPVAGAMAGEPSGLSSQLLLLGGLLIVASLSAVLVYRLVSIQKR